MKQYEKDIVGNIRRQLGNILDIYTDTTILKAWLMFSGSEDYPNMEVFTDWCEMFDGDADR